MSAGTVVAGQPGLMRQGMRTGRTSPGWWPGIAQIPRLPPAWRCPGSCDMNPDIVPAERQPVGFPRRLGASPVTAFTTRVTVDRYLRFPGGKCPR